ncbi:MAG: RNA polymerase sigma factor [Pirellulales bacterium]
MIRIRSNDEDGWRRLVRLYGPLVVRWCRRMGLAEANAADVSQEVFQAVTTQIGQFRRERPTDSFRAWLYGITRNKVRDVWRKQADSPAAIGGTTIQHRFQQMPDHYDADLKDAPQEFQEVLRRAMDLVQVEFTEKSWQAFWQVTIDGRKPSDVAADLEMSAGAVYIAKSRALKRLREELDGLEEIE